MFRLVITVRRGSACNLPRAWQRCATLDDARVAAGELLRHERITHVTIVRNEMLPVFVEWQDR